MIDLSTVKLGKLPKREDPRTFKLSKYLLAENLPLPPRCLDWSAADRDGFPMFRNNEIGDCAFASPAHLIEIWTANAAEEQTVTDEEVIAAYSAVTGYVPGDPSTDNGTVMLDALKFWRNTGIGGHKIIAFCEINPQSAFEVQVGMWLFGGLYGGFRLPVSVQTDKEIWRRHENDGGIWGGHAVATVGSDSAEKQIITWGARQRMSNNFFKAYCDELYAVLSQDWIGKAGLSPSGFDLVQLNKDLAALG